MKYQTTIFDFPENKQTHINILAEDGSITTFPALVDNPEYVKFLEEVSKTDKEIYALKANTWFEL